MEHIGNYDIQIKHFLRRAGKGRGTKIISDKKGRGNPQKSDVPGGARGGMGAEQFDPHIRNKKHKIRN